MSSIPTTIADWERWKALDVAGRAAYRAYHDARGEPDLDFDNSIEPEQEAWRSAAAAALDESKRRERA